MSEGATTRHAIRPAPNFMGADRSENKGKAKQKAKAMHKEMQKMTRNR